MGSPKNGGTFLGPFIKDYSILGVYIGVPPIQGSCHMTAITRVNVTAGIIVEVIIRFRLLGSGFDRMETAMRYKW